MFNRDFGYFALSILVYYFLLHFFVIPQIEIISSLALFLSLTLILMTLAFFSSAIEAGYSAAPSSNSLSNLITEDKTALAVKFAPIEEKIAEHGFAGLSDEDRRKFERLQKKLGKLNDTEKAFQPDRRAQNVGAFASLSVIINTSLAAFLPLSISDNSSKELVTVPGIDLTISDSSVSWQAVMWDWTGSELVVFLVVSIPTIILGKIVPKELGSRKPEFYAFKLHKFSRGVIWSLKAVPASQQWLINKIHPM